MFYVVSLIHKILLNIYFIIVDEYTNTLLIFFFTVLWISEIGLTIFGVLWAKKHFTECAISTGNKNVILGKQETFIALYVE